jgi:hypothetical protein
MLSVLATCRQQSINLLDYLTRCYRAHLDGLPAPFAHPLLGRSDPLISCERLHHREERARCLAICQPASDFAARGDVPAAKSGAWRFDQPARKMVEAADVR